MQAAYELNGRSVNAEAFYARACDPHRSVAVEACAGAGKTWILVSRVVRALLDGAAADEILAITFTKRSAGEMRERLYEWLAEFARADRATLVNELRARGIAILDDGHAGADLPEQLSKLYRSTLESGREVQVRTFHSWFAALLRTAPLSALQQLGLPTAYELLEDDAPAQALLLPRFYAALRLAPQLQADFEAVVFEFGRTQTTRALQAALSKRTEFALADAHGVVDASVQHFADQHPEFKGLAAPDDLLSAREHRQALQAAAAALLGAGAKTFAGKGLELELALTRGDVSAALAALLTKDDAPRKFSENIVGIQTVREAQDLALRVVAGRVQHGAWLYQQRMARLTRLLLDEFAALKRERGWVDMNDVERAALVMLSDPVLSGWVQERLDVRVKHLLIDEFQDTNPLQWLALKSWLSAYAGASASAPSVFLVGDPKQSIYRFRRAEPQVFKAAQDFVRDALGGDLLSCDHTRRSASRVMDTVNAVMSEAARADAYDGFRRHTSSSTQSGMVCRLPSIARPAAAADAGDDHALGDSSRLGAWRDSLCTAREEAEETLHTLEARQAAAWIAQQLGRLDKAALAADPRVTRVMVLARRRAALSPLQGELRRLGIAARLGEKSELADCCEVQDMAALLDVLVSGQHDLSLARVLKSPLFSLDDAALVQLALAQQQGGACWLDLLGQLALLAPDGRHVAQCLARWKAWLDTLPPHDALQAIYFDGDVLARYCAAAPAFQSEVVLANLRELLAVALRIDGGRFATPYALVRALKAGGMRAPVAVSSDAVQLLTIHGAKGLEAHTVLLLDTDAAERNADTMGVLVDWPGEDGWPRRFIFLASEKQPPACALALLEHERAQRAREELNALYVALTRARHTLAVSSIEPHRAAERSWWRRLVDLTHEVAAPPATPIAAAFGEPATSLLPLKELPPLRPAPPR